MTRTKRRCQPTATVQLNGQQKPGEWWHLQLELSSCWALFFGSLCNVCMNLLSYTYIRFESCFLYFEVKLPLLTPGLILTLSTQLSSL